MNDETKEVKRVASPEGIDLIILIGGTILGALVGIGASVLLGGGKDSHSTIVEGTTIPLDDILNPKTPITEVINE